MARSRKEVGAEMNTNLIVASCAAQASRHVVAPTGVGFEGRGVSIAGTQAIAGRLIGMTDDRRTGLPTWHKRPQTDLYFRLRAPQV